ncbi:hypothetical protein ENUP19_0124G0033 [Entamoeba nuttalli]|uniref:phosphatidylinositol-3,5-bisphosphate 3-phosphatase n=1 Tax=Entamoeba nuttalli TaxID=412467 RepID=A0ABQ0DJ78_9EUKA
MESSDIIHTPCDDKGFDTEDSPSSEITISSENESFSNDNSQPKDKMINDSQEKEEKERNICNEKGSIHENIKHEEMTKEKIVTKTPTQTPTTKNCSVGQKGKPSLISIKELSISKSPQPKQEQKLNIEVVECKSPTSPIISPRQKFTPRASMIQLVKGCPEEQIIIGYPVSLMNRNDVINFKGPMNGQLTLTNYKVVFVVKCVIFNVSIPLTKIADFKKVNSMDKQHKRLFYLETKDNRKYVFSFENRRDERKQFNLNLLESVFTTSPEKMFIYHSNSPPISHSYYQIAVEFERQGTPDTWRVFTGNQNYELAPTYPSLTYVPVNASDEIIKDSMKHRSKGRFPVLTWYNKKNGSVIVRSAQPLPGMVTPVTGKNTSGDVTYLQLIDETTGKRGIHVLDSRPKLNAYTNKAAGGGYEDETTYPFVKVEFENIDNIHVVREIWTNVALAAFSWEGELEEQKFMKLPEVKEWFNLIETIFVSVKKAIRYLIKGESLLIHCSDGWDRTSQCCSLVELLLDKYYRTLEGFIVLIEKDWKSFGHQFEKRSGIGVVCPHGQYSPIFFQFLDCVNILIHQFPDDFEFNEQFLLELNDAIFCSDFGTFMFDCEKTRKESGVELQTPSFWEYVVGQKCKFINPSYKDETEELILEDKQPKLILWTKYFTRYKIKMSR